MERGSMFFIIKFYVKFQMDATIFQFISLFSKRTQMATPI